MFPKLLVCIPSTHMITLRQELCQLSSSHLTDATSRLRTHGHTYMVKPWVQSVSRQRGSRSWPGEALGTQHQPRLEGKWRNPLSSVKIRKDHWGGGEAGMRYCYLLNLCSVLDKDRVLYNLTFVSADKRKWTDSKKTILNQSLTNIVAHASYLSTLKRNWWRIINRFTRCSEVSIHGHAC